MLREGGIGVLPTDTLYGIVACALNARAVQRLYRLRKRNPKKPMIILIASAASLRGFGVRLSPHMRSMLNEYWPGKVSAILPLAAGRKHAYLHRGTNTLAFRVPAWPPLRRFLKITGPLVAPSANIEGKPPALTIGEAGAYFGNAVQFYIDRGPKRGRPSRLIAFGKEGIQVLR